MDIKELQIGNYVTSNEYENFKVEGVSISLDGRWNQIFFYINGWVKTERIKNLKPIPLTNKWLIDFGFIKYMDGNFVINNETLSITKDKKTDIYYACFDNIIIRKIENVNELQNLYFFITQKELTLKQLFQLILAILLTTKYMKSKAIERCGEVDTVECLLAANNL